MDAGACDAVCCTASQQMKATPRNAGSEPLPRQPAAAEWRCRAPMTRLWHGSGHRRKPRSDGARLQGGRPLGPSIELVTDPGLGVTLQEAETCHVTFETKFIPPFHFYLRPVLLQATSQYVLSQSAFTG